MSTEKPQTSVGSSFGTGLALLVTGLFILSFVKFTGITSVFMWLMYAWGFTFCVAGIFGACLTGPDYVKELVVLRKQ
jgi:hypothetical protein